MKKLLLCATMLLASAYNAFAQDDASAWKPGDEITEQIEWGNLDFTSNPITYWKYSKEKGGDPTSTAGLFEMYDCSGCDVYQYVKLPAGMYRVECQGYYRCGDSGNVDPNSFDSDSWEDNALLYVQNGTYTEETGAFVAGRTFKCPLMPRLFERVGYQLYQMPEEENPGWDMSDGYYDAHGCYGPCSVPGSLEWFNAGYYKAFNEDGVKYNTVTFFLTEPGYVKLGVSKQNAKAQDSFMVTNFQMYYVGEGGEGAEIMILQDEAATLYNEITKIIETANDNGNYSIYNIVSNLLSEEFDEVYGSVDGLMDKGIEEAKKAIEVLTNIKEGAVKSDEALKALAGVIENMNVLLNTTDYAGKDKFQEIVDYATSLVDGSVEITGDETVNTIPDVYANILQARFDYLLSQEKVDGAYDFSSAIYAPFFCKNEYSPKWDAESNMYKYSEEIEDTWVFAEQEKDYQEIFNDHSDWLPICEGIQLTESFKENAWVMKTTCWRASGGPAKPQMQHGYTAVGGWKANPDGNPEILYQTITNLPDGYYSMSAMMCNPQELSPDLAYVYIENSNGDKEVCRLMEQSNPWWSGAEQWRQNWSKLNTGVVKVTDGKVTIGVYSDTFYGVTGFQLYYYGNEPAYSKLLEPRIDAAWITADKLAFGGDRAHVYELLTSVPENIITKEDYESACAILDQIDDYVTVANKAANDYRGLQNKYDDLTKEIVEGDDPRLAIIEVAKDASNQLGTGEDNVDTYKDTEAFIKAFNEYAAWCTLYPKAVERNSDKVNAVLAQQVSALTESFASAETVSEYQKAIMAIINEDVFAELGADKATEANPVNITTLLANPSFAEGPKTGWTCVGDDCNPSVNTYGRQLAECWNQKPFEISQTLKALPEGAYELRVRACYRDEGGVNQDMINRFLACEGDYSKLEYNNAVLFANENTSYVKSVVDGEWTDPSFTIWWNAKGSSEASAAGFMSDWDGTICILEGEEDILTEDDKYSMEQNINYDNPGYPFDTKVGEYYYPSSMAGFQMVIKKHDDAYCNSVQVMVEEGGELKLGLRKTAARGGDWLIYDDFELYYLGKETPSAVEKVNASNKVSVIYNVAGQRLNSLQKGINIVDGKKVFIK